jgi:predicted nucleotidyltransferase
LLDHPIADLVRAALTPHPAVQNVRLVGSRERAEEGPLSDWDFAVDAANPRAAAAAVPQLVESLEPLAAQWDRLAESSCFMLMLPGPAKVDLLLDLPHRPKPPWVVDATTLPAIDQHFWDWLLWIASKDVQDRTSMVHAELVKMSHHLLRPMGEAAIPEDVESAGRQFRRARARHEIRTGVAIARRLEWEVAGALRGHGYDL